MNNSSMFSMTFKLGYEFILFIGRQMTTTITKAKAMKTWLLNQ